MRDVLAWFNCGDRTSERGRGRSGILDTLGPWTLHLWGVGEREERGRAWDRDRDIKMVAGGEGRGVEAGGGIEIREDSRQH